MLPNKTKAYQFEKYLKSGSGKAFVKNILDKTLPHQTLLHPVPSFFHPEIDFEMGIKQDKTIT
jgi:hypothetical protein